MKVTQIDLTELSTDLIEMMCAVNNIYNIQCKVGIWKIIRSE